MKEGLRKRISAALDAPGGLAADRDLVAVLDGQPEAAAYARDLAKIDGALRGWPLPEPSDETMEALALRIEQRIEGGEDLPRIADPTQAPIFDDEDELRDATAGLIGGDPPSLDGVAIERVPSVTSGEYEMLDRISEVPEERAAAMAPNAIVREAAKPESVRPAAKPASPGRPPPPSAEPVVAAAPAVPPAVRSLPKLATVAEIKRAKDDPDRISFAPPEPASAPANVTPIRKEPPRARWMPALAAAAAIGLGIFVTTSVYESGGAPTPSQMVSQGAPAPAPSAPAVATPTASGAAALDRYAEAEEAAMPMEAPAAEPMAPTTPVTATAMPAPPPVAAPLPGAAEGSSGFGGGAPPRAPARIAAGASSGAPIADADGIARARRAATGPAASAAMGGTSTSTGGARGGAAGAGGGGGGIVAGGGAPATGSGTSSMAEAPAQREAAPTTTTESASRDHGEAREEARADTRPGTQAPAAASPTPADLPAAPSRGEVLAAIQSIEPAVRACAADQHGTATVRIVVAPTGRVTTATVSGPFAGTPVGSCVARAVRTGRFPPFSGDRFEITYPFTL